MIAFAIHAIGKRKAPFTPESASHVYKTACLSKLLYGLEVYVCYRNCNNGNGMFSCQSGKDNPAPPRELAKIGAAFLWRLLLLPMESIYKKVLLARYVYLTETNDASILSPLWILLQTAKKMTYMIVRTSIDTGNYGLV